MLVDGIQLDEFTAAGTVADLVNSRCSSVVAQPGVYVVLRTSSLEPQFLETSTGGWFKGRDPSYPLVTVQANWVPGATVLYVGMTTSTKGLRQRLRQLADFGNGKAVAHRGGRLLWHLSDSSDLSVLWNPCEKHSARGRESDLINDFRRRHGVRPFANMNG